MVAAGIEPIIPDRYRLGALIRLLSEYLDRHRFSTFTPPASTSSCAAGRLELTIG